MRTAVDAIRSLKRYVSECLPDWEVRLAEEQAAFRRPCVLVGPAGAERWSGPATRTDSVLPTSIHCYPEAGASPAEAMLGALGIAEALYQGFRVGIGYGGPMRVPLWDYDDVPLDQPAVSRLAYPGDDNRWHGDYLRVAGLSVNRIRDPDDPNLYDVVADCRLGWSRGGRLPSEGETMRSFTITGGGT